MNLKTCALWTALAVVCFGTLGCNSKPAGTESGGTPAAETAEPGPAPANTTDSK